jgi:hypothetical protein
MANPVMLGCKGADVAELHRRMIVQGIDVPLEERREDHFGPGTEVMIRELQARSGLATTGVLDDATARVLGLAGASARSIEGRVSRADGSPLADVAVRLCEPSLDGDVVLDTTHAAADGSFSFAWPKDHGVTLILRADGAAETPVAALDASPSGVVWARVSLGGAYTGPSKFTALTAAIAPRLGKAALHMLGAERASDLKRVSESSGVRAHDVSKLVLAHKLAAETPVPAAAFFALFAHGVPAELGSTLLTNEPLVFDEAQVAHVLDTILQVRGDNVERALRAAVADQTVSDLDVDEIARQLHALKLERIAARPYQLGKTPFRDVLATVLPDPVAQQRVFEACAARGGGDELWATLEASGHFTAQQLEDLRFTLGTSLLLRHHLPLLQHAQKLRADGAIRATADLARLDREDWARLLHQTDPAAEQLTFTANMTFASLNERIDQFAATLADHFERQYPTAAFAGRLARRHAELRPALAAPEGLQRLLDRHPAFDLQHTHIDRFLHDGGPAALAGIADADRVIADLKKVQRLYKLTSRFAHVQAMLAAGHTSAQSIYAAGRTRLVTMLTSAGATQGQAGAIFDRAEQAHATTLALLGNFHSAFTKIAPSVVAPPISSDAVQRALGGASGAGAAATVAASFPDLQSLFGNTDYCACEHCRAIHGPAAYLVDLLEFLKRRTVTGGGSARDVLFARRADLGAIELSCDNTNGVVPYVDLVCEVLEDAVSAPTTAAVRVRQTAGTAQERRANPAFVNDGAYGVLRTAVFPHAAPFDLWTAEVRGFLRQLGVPWHDLLAAFQSSASGPTDTQVAGERLGFNANALAIVTTPSPAQPWLHWGLQEVNNSLPDPRKPDVTTPLVTGTWLQVLGAVPIFLDRTKLAHRELVQLLATRFINPGGAITIVDAGDAGFATCDTGKQTIQTWTVEALSRFGRFLRLWRQLACPIWQLDKSLCTTAVGNNQIDAAAIAALGRFEQIASRLAVPRDELLGLWSEVDRFNYLNVLDDAEVVVRSVYARRFRDATVAPSSVFVEDPALLGGPLSAPEALAGISAALGLSIDDIQRIRAAENLGPTAPLTLATLSVLFRYAVLAGAVRLSVAELVTAIAVTGVNPFASPATTLGFLDALDRAHESGFALLELHYLLRHGSVVESGIALTDAVIAARLDELRKGMVRLGTVTDELLAQQVSDLVPLDPALTALLLQITLPGGTTPIGALFTNPALTQRAPDGTFVAASDRAHFAAIFDAFVVLDKLRTVVSRWRISHQDATWLVQHAAEVGWLAPYALPASAASPVSFAAFDALRRNLVMQQTLVAANEARLFDVVLARGGARNAVATAVAALGDWPAADVIAIADRFGWATGAALVADATAPRIRELLAWPRKLASDMPTTLGFVTTAVTATEARKARQLTKARYDLDQWYAIAGAIQDGLREQKRAALVAWLLANPDGSRGQRWANVEELYGFYLIDPEMSPSAATTRIKQAAASVQLFVQRCFLQREPTVVVVDDPDGWTQWDWMKQFRLWEANRKIFLYPENWLDPGQRRDKSELFVNLENELHQSDISADTAEAALQTFLHTLADVSHLEISGLCTQAEEDNVRTLHVVGRTRKAPNVYYYRHLDPTGAWSAWEKIDAEISTNHILPVYWNRRLHVFWPEFTEKSLPPSAASLTVPAGGGGTSSSPITYWEIALAWTERRRDRWTPKRVNQRKLPAPFPRYEERLWAFKAPAAGRALQVDVYAMGVPPTRLYHVAEWNVTSGEDEPVLLGPPLGNPGPVDGSRYVRPLTTAQMKPPLTLSATLDWEYNGLRSLVGAAGLSILEGSPQQDLPVLGKFAPGTVMMEHQDPSFLSLSPFFISDMRRTFFMVPAFVTATFTSIEPPGEPIPYTTEYRPEIFYHPFVGRFLQELEFHGIEGLYNRTLQSAPGDIRGPALLDFAVEYAPTTAIAQRPAPSPPYPTETIDYSHGGAYASYNWELFVHVPLLIAKRLADNQKFDDALRWFHYIFNPNATAGGAAPQRYWNPRVFSDLLSPDYQQQQIERLLQLVHQGDPELVKQVAAWRRDPFDPHRIAASRPVAYQKAIVMQYIATLIAWGDQLFRGDTIESINAATQLYLLASELLGPRPQNLRARRGPTASSRHSSTSSRTRWSISRTSSRSRPR